MKYFGEIVLVGKTALTGDILDGDSWIFQHFFALSQPIGSYVFQDGLLIGISETLSQSRAAAVKITAELIQRDLTGKVGVDIFLDLDGESLII